MSGFGSLALGWSGFQELDFSYWKALCSESLGATLPTEALHIPDDRKQGKESYQIQEAFWKHKWSWGKQLVQSCSLGVQSTAAHGQGAW